MSVSGEASSLPLDFGQNWDIMGCAISVLLEKFMVEREDFVKVLRQLRFEQEGDTGLFVQKALGIRVDVPELRVYKDNVLVGDPYTLDAMVSFLDELMHYVGERVRCYVSFDQPCVIVHTIGKYKLFNTLRFPPGSPEFELWLGCFEAGTYGPLEDFIRERHPSLF